jgi:hypothetical protein
MYSQSLTVTKQLPELEASLEVSVEYYIFMLLSNLICMVAVTWCQVRDKKKNFF